VCICLPLRSLSPVKKTVKIYYNIKIYFPWILNLKIRKMLLLKMLRKVSEQHCCYWEDVLWGCCSTGSSLFCACVCVCGCIAGDDSETCGELAQSASLVYSYVSSWMLLSGCKFLFAKKSFLKYCATYFQDVILSRKFDLFL